MKVAVVTFPGSNCDEDAVFVARDVIGAETESVWHEARSLPAGTDVVVLPGGFSYGDALRAGALARLSPIMAAVATHAERGGYVLGICNGFQVLLEAGLLPGAMLPNDSRKFVCRAVELEVRTAQTPFSCRLEAGARLWMPVAHHQGRYYADDDTLERLAAEDQIVFTYASDNPNGSCASIAGIVNAKRNVLGMMPHPERAADETLGSVDGEGVFRSVASVVEAAS